MSQKKLVSIKAMNENIEYTKKSNKNSTALALIVLVGAIFGYIIISMNSKLHADEKFHAVQIWMLYESQGRLAGNITVPPTYHYAIAKITQLVGVYHDNLLRLISLLVGLLAVPAIYHIAKHYNPVNAWEKTLSIYFAPLIFPYFFVIYTDIWSLAAIATTILLALQRHFFWAGITGAIAIIIRQDNAAWVGLTYLYICFDAIKHFNKESLIRFILNALTKGAVFNMVFIAFLAFIYINGGVAIGDANAHKISSFNIANLHIFLISCWALFLPLHIQQLPRIISLLKKPIILLIIFIAFISYVATLKNVHPYNNMMYDYFIHNAFIRWLAENPLIKSLSFIPAAWAFLSLATMPIPDWRWRLLLPVAILAAISHPLIETRYYIPAFFLIHILRPSASRQVEAAVIILYAACSSYILYGITTNKFFL